MQNIFILLILTSIHRSKLKCYFTYLVCSNYNLSVSSLLKRASSIFLILYYSDSFALFFSASTLSCSILSFFSSSPLSYSKTIYTLSFFFELSFCLFWLWFWTLKLIENTIYCCYLN